MILISILVTCFHDSRNEIIEVINRLKCINEKQKNFHGMLYIILPFSLVIYCLFPIGLAGPYNNQWLPQISGLGLVSEWLEFSIMVLHNILMYVGISHISQSIIYLMHLLTWLAFNSFKEQTLCRDNLNYWASSTSPILYETFALIINKNYFAKLLANCKHMGSVMASYIMEQSR